jgi:hypothetical protein
MAKSNAYAEDILRLLFNATEIGGVAENDTTSPLANLYVALHTADPGEAGAGNTNEVSYTSYARVAVARTTGGWVVSGTNVAPAEDIDFPACTGGTATATHASIGAAASGASKIFYKGALDQSIVISNGVAPKILAATTLISED